MAVRQGFLLIDLMIALFLFMVLASAVVRIQATIIQMHHEIAARTEMIGALRRAIEPSSHPPMQSYPTFAKATGGQGGLDGSGGMGSGTLGGVIRVGTDRALPLHNITIKKHRAKAQCSLEVVGWVYE